MSKSYSVIIGLGETGLSVARFMAHQKKSFVMMDTRDAPPNLNAFRTEFPEAAVYTKDWPQDILNKAQQIIASPGISKDIPALATARKNNVEIIGDIELFVRNQSAPIIAITGSNGKSTVTALVGEMAKACFANVAVVGNIGDPVLNTLLRNEKPEYVVMELSSFQLETTSSLKPIAATILNISPDHLDRYDSFEDYIQAKHRIYHHAKHVILNKDDPLTSSTSIAPSSQKIYFTLQVPQANEFGLKRIENETWLCSGNEPIIAQRDLHIFGQHNVANALAALALGTAAGFDKAKMCAALKAFKGLNHRCELVIEQSGIRWINDSKGTNIGATTAALEGIGAQLMGKIVLLLGGDGKGADFSMLLEGVRKYCRGVIVMGQDAKAIANALTGVMSAQFATNMQEAVQAAKNMAKPGDCVLLSPACSSLDQYKNFGHRGEVFVACVRAILEKNQNSLSL